MSVAPAIIGSSAESPQSNAIILEVSAGKLESKSGGNGDYKGFVAGVASGITKLTSKPEFFRWFEAREIN